MKTATHVVFSYRINTKLLSVLSVVKLILIITNVSAKQEDSTTKSYRNSFINPYPRYSAYNDGGDPGQPLFLTPLINNPNITKEEVRKMAAVDVKQFLGVESYSGYLTVDPKFNSSMFFWYFPAENAPSYAPVLLWLQGGPGASSLFGLFAENGPFELDFNGNLAKRNYTWSLSHNLIYIDNPVGTGFSFTQSDAGYARNEKDVGHNLHEAIQQLYELFDFKNSLGFWITGESYAGKYVPALAYHIHMVQNSVNTRVTIPLKGIAIGNGLSDPLHQLKYGDYLFQLGLIDENGLERFHAAEAQGVKYIKEHKMEDAFKTFDSLINGDQSNGSIFNELTGYDFYYNYLKTKDDGIGSVLGKFLQSSSTRRAIHVGNKAFHDLDTENKVEEHLKLDIMDTVAPWIAELLKSYTVCIYNGQLDIIVAYPLTRNYLHNLKFADAALYKLAKRQVWTIDGEIAGYFKVAGNLREIMVRNAGHMAPSDQPKWMYNLIYNLTHPSSSKL